MSETPSCPYCVAGQPDYDIDCGGCRARFRFDHNGKFAATKRLEYVFRTGTNILQVHEELEE